MPNQSFKALYSVGFRDRVAFVGKHVNKEKINVDFMRAFPQFCYDKYRWIFPDVEMVNRATRRFDQELKLDYEPEIFQQAFELLIELHGDLEGKCKVKTPYETKTRKMSSTGPNYEYKYRKMGDLIVNEWPEFEACWQMAAVMDVPVYWKASGKEEMLPTEKVDRGDCRTFIFPDGPHRYCGQRLNQDINDRLGAGKSPWCAVGFDRTHGGFTALGEQLDQWYRIVEGDLTKYDARQHPVLHMMCMMFRWCCLKLKYRTQANWKRLVHNYKNKVHSLIFLPTGQCVYVPLGNKSGQDSTTYDNTLIHEFIYLYECIKYCMALGLAATLANIMQNILPKLYGDDSCSGISKLFSEHMESTFGSIPKALEQMYARWGMLFKTAECKVQDTVEGLKFIGGIFKKTEYGWAHTFNVDRVMSAMVRDISGLKPDVQWSKWTSLLALSAFEDSRHAIRKWMQQERPKMQSKATLPMQIPSDYDLYAFWFGWEQPKSLIHVNREQFEEICMAA